MYRFIELFFQIAILRKGPQDVPASPTMFWLLLPVFAGVNLLILFLSGFTWAGVLLIAINLLLMAGFSWTLLHFADKTARFPQTFCALVGIDTLISFCQLPAVAGLNSEAADFASLAILGLMVWQWLVSGHIYRHALDRPLFFGLGLALLYILISYQVMAVLFPVVSTPT
jgi:hypothetical protein